MRLMLAPAGGGRTGAACETSPLSALDRELLRARLAKARLYLVFDSAPPRHTVPDLLRAARAGGVDIVQLRDKHLGDEELAAVANAVARLCAELDLLFIVNDRPPSRRRSARTGARRAAGHAGRRGPRAARLRPAPRPVHARAAEIDAVDPLLVDYIGVGPVHATPTKPGRPAVGLELGAPRRLPRARAVLRHRRLERANIPEVLGAGAARVCVLRAIADAEDPELAAREIAALLAQPPGGAPGRDSA